MSHWPNESHIVISAVIVMEDPRGLPILYSSVGHLIEPVTFCKQARNDFFTLITLKELVDKCPLRCLPLNPGVVLSCPTKGQDHDSSYDTGQVLSTGWFQEADSTVIYLSCENLFHNRAKINLFKLC